MIRGITRRTLGALVVSLLLAGPALGQDTAIKRDDAKFLAIFKPVIASAAKSTIRLVSEVTYEEKGESKTEKKDLALATVVGGDGWLLTKASLVNGPVFVKSYTEGRGPTRTIKEIWGTCDTVFAKLRDGKEVAAKIVGVDDKYDLAMLKVEARDLPVIDFAESKTAPAGHWLASVGPGEEPVAVGVVSVATRKFTPEQLKAMRGPNANSGFLGIGLENSDEGPRISEVQPRTAAERAKLQAGDVILSIDGKAVTNRETVIDVLGKMKPDDKVKLKILREGEEKELNATLGKRPTDRGDFQNNLGSTLSVRRNGFPSILQHDTVIKPTDCGGPLVDLDGKCVGINIARAGRVESYALPSEAVQPLLADLKSGKLAPPPPDMTARIKALEQKVSDARDLVRKAEDARAALAKKIADGSVAKDKAEAETKTADKKVADAKAALQKVEDDLKKIKK